MKTHRDVIVEEFEYTFCVYSDKKSTEQLKKQIEDYLKHDTKFIAYDNKEFEVYVSMLQRDVECPLYYVNISVTNRFSYTEYPPTRWDPGDMEFDGGEEPLDEEGYVEIIEEMLKYLNLEDKIRGEVKTSYSDYPDYIPLDIDPDDYYQDTWY